VYKRNLQQGFKVAYDKEAPVGLPLYILYILKF